MKRLLLLVASMLTLAAVSFAGSPACGDCPCRMEGVTKNVENLEDGVKVTLSATDPKLVAMIQEKMVTCEAGRTDCPMMAKEMDRRVEKTADGMVMTITSTDKDLVKKLQTHVAAEFEGHKGGKQHGKDCSHHQKSAT
jgi:TusA-related sulfurtransferase